MIKWTVRWPIGALCYWHFRNTRVFFVSNWKFNADARRVWRSLHDSHTASTIASCTVMALSDVLVAHLSCRLRLKCDGTRAETRFRLSAKRTSPFKSTVPSVQSTTGSRGVRISGSNAGYTMFRGSVKSTGYPLHSPVFPSLPLPCVTVCHHVSTGLYHVILWHWCRMGNVTDMMLN
jgi:hypothetical protein